MKKRVTYRPSRAQGILGTVMGVVFVVIGLVIVVPTFGLFGLAWTGMAVIMTGINAYHAFGKGYIGPRIEIEEEEERQRPPAERGGSDVRTRLEQLEELKRSNLLTDAEYKAKRAEILKDL